MKGQAAIEYLVTYGWAIIIIAVVISALYALGIFNSSSYYTSKIQPGACNVYRPYGPGSLQEVGLQGYCGSGIPEYVATFNENATSYVQVNDISLLDPSNYISISVWVKPSAQLASNPGGTTDHDLLSKGNEACGNGASPTSSYTMAGGSGTLQSIEFCVQTPSQAYESPGFAPNTGQWYYVVGTYNGVDICLYVDASLVGCNTASGGLQSSSLPLIIGGDSYSSHRNYNGSLANVQLYNKSLSASEVSTLYFEGIGGPPQLLQNLMGWWPLNYDFKDYSGNNADGTGDVPFEAQWLNGYSAP